MTTGLAVRRTPIAEPRSLFSANEPEPPRRTLEAAVLATLDERRLRGTAPCLVCGEAVDGGGACRHCGSELS
jgi:hypothetical protein